MAKFWRAPQKGDVFSIPEDVIECVPEAIARGNCVLPFAFDDASVSLYVSAEHPDPEFLRSRLAKFLKRTVQFSPLPYAVIDGCLDMYYPATDSHVNAIKGCAEQFRFVCPRIWESLEPTDQPGVRHCPECNESVYECMNAQQLESLRGIRKCVALGMVCGGI